MAFGFEKLIVNADCPGLGSIVLSAQACLTSGLIMVNETTKLENLRHLAVQVIFATTTDKP